MSSLISHLRRGFGENVRFAMIAVRAHKLRAALTVLGIVVGVSTVIAMVSIVNGLQQQHGPQASRASARPSCSSRSSRCASGPGHRSDTERNRKDLTLEDALALKAQIPEIRGVSPERYLFDGTNVTVKYRGQESTAPTVAGVYPDYSLANNHFVEHGRFFTDADIEHSSEVAVIGTDVQKALFPAREPAQQDRRAERLEVHRHRRHGGEGRLRRRLQQPLVLHSLLDLRPPVPADQEQPGRHDPHRDRARTGRTRSTPSSRRAGRCCARAAACRSTPRTTSTS